MPNFLLPAGGALTIMDIGMQMSSGALYQTYEVWCRLSIVCLSCIKHDYPIAKGGAMIITEYWPLDVFRHGLIPKCEVCADWTLHV